MLDFATLKPVDGSPAAIRTAIQSAGRLAEIVAATLPHTKARLDQALVFGSAEELPAAEAVHREVTLDAERLVTAHKHLEELLSQAEAAQPALTLEEAKAAAFAAGAELAGWWMAVQPMLMEQFTRGSTLLTRALETAATLTMVEAASLPPAPANRNEPAPAGEPQVKGARRHAKRPRPR